MTTSTYTTAQIATMRTETIAALSTNALRVSPPPKLRAERHADQGADHRRGRRAEQ